MQGICNYRVLMEQINARTLPTCFTYFTFELEKFVVLCGQPVLRTGSPDIKWNQNSANCVAACCCTCCTQKDTHTQMHTQEEKRVHQKIIIINLHMWNRLCQKPQINVCACVCVCNIICTHLMFMLFFRLFFILNIHFYDNDNLT